MWFQKLKQLLPGNEVEQIIDTSRLLSERDLQTVTSRIPKLQYLCRNYLLEVGTYGITQQFLLGNIYLEDGTVNIRQLIRINRIVHAEITDHSILEKLADIENLFTELLENRFMFFIPNDRQTLKDPITLLLKNRTSHPVIQSYIAFLQDIGQADNLNALTIGEFEKLAIEVFRKYDFSPPEEIKLYFERVMEYLAYNYGLVSRGSDSADPESVSYSAHRSLAEIANAFSSAKTIKIQPVQLES